MAKNVMGLDNDPLYYLIRMNQSEGCFPSNDFEQQMYQLPHTGNVYNREKKMVWGNILKAFLNTPSWKWIKYFEAMEDSRAAWNFLVEKCEGQDATNKRVLIVTMFVSPNSDDRGALYSNEYQFLFEKYITNIQKEYSKRTLYHNVFLSQFILQRMIGEIQSQARVLGNLLRYCLASVSYMSAKVEIQFPPRSGVGSKRNGDYQDLQIRLQERTWRHQRKRPQAGLSRPRRSPLCI